MHWFWLALAIALVVIELSTTQLVSIWFAIGAGVTAIVKVIAPGISIPWQALIFVGVSTVLFLATRPFVKKLTANRGKEHETNLELIVGKEAVVTEDIDNIKGTGAVKINGLEWSARTADNSEILTGEIVVIKEIMGNKLIVEGKGE